MHEIPNKVDFYITNVCNLTCDDCNRFNNYNFTGWQNWADYESTYQRWAQLVKLRAITIMGGEPFLNPSLISWIQGLNQTFGVEVQILTNGTRFRQAADVYPALLWTHPETKMKNHIGVSLHNTNDFEQIHTDILAFLQAPVAVLPKGQNRWGSYWHYEDRNGVEVNLYLKNEFGSSAIRKTINGTYTLYNNNPEAAHNACAFAQWKSYHFIRGALYKCGPSALLPEFDQQHQFDISELDRELLHSYQPLTPDNFQQRSKEFFSTLDQPIPQCKFCPVEYNAKTIWPLRKNHKG